MCDETIYSAERIATTTTYIGGNVDESKTYPNNSAYPIARLEERVGETLADLILESTFLMNQEFLIFKIE